MHMGSNKVNKILVLSFKARKDIQINVKVNNNDLLINQSLIINQHGRYIAVILNKLFQGHERSFTLYNIK